VESGPPPALAPQPAAGPPQRIPHGRAVRAAAPPSARIGIPPRTRTGIRLQ